MKNIMNFCFGLKRAEKVNEKAVSPTYHGYWNMLLFEVKCGVSWFFFTNSQWTLCEVSSIRCNSCLLNHTSSILSCCYDTLRRPTENILNMDTSSPDGLSFAFANQIVNSNKVDVIVSNYFLSGSALFTDLHKGKTFTILRHPVDIALSLFHYRRKASWERSFRKDWNTLTFHDYVSSDDYMDSWMVRQLTGTMPWVELNESHLERAKLVMKRKIFVGVLEEMDETIRQFKMHFGWEEKQPFCAYNYLHDTPTNKNEHPGLQGGRGGKTWHVIIAKEKWDLSLYHYGLELFAAQRQRYPPKSADGSAPLADLPTDKSAVGVFNLYQP